MALAQTKLYTETDYYNLPEEVRAELIDGELNYIRKLNLYADAGVREYWPVL